MRKVPYSPGIYTIVCEMFKYRTLPPLSFIYSKHLFFTNLRNQIIIIKNNITHKNVKNYAYIP